MLGALGTAYALTPATGGPPSAIRQTLVPRPAGPPRRNGHRLHRATPVSHIDVQLVQRTGLDAALHGHDPFSVTFPDIHHNPALYPPGLVRDGVVHLGFPYPPLTFLLDLPTHILLGDYRYTNLLCMLASALLVAACRPGVLPKLIAALYLYTPRTFLVSNAAGPSRSRYCSCA